jgi:hypothetical protein
VKSPVVYWRALRAIWRALRGRRYEQKPRAASASAKRSRARMRSRRAVVKLGGACACCGLGIDFLPVLEFHHVNHNGALHRDVMRALDTGVRGWILTHPDPRAGLFALEVLCVVCHRMRHEAGACPHQREMVRSEGAQGQGRAHARHGRRHGL